MIYAKKIETAAHIGEIPVPSSYFLDKELFYKNKQGEYEKKEDLTVEGMIGIHRIKERRWSDHPTQVLAKKAVEKLKTRPELLIVGHNADVPVPAVSGIAQYVQQYENAAFFDILTDSDLPGEEIAQAMVDSGKYQNVVYASSPKISSMTRPDKFDKNKFLEDAILIQKESNTRLTDNIDPKSIDLIIIDHMNFLGESKSNYVKGELDWGGVYTLDVIAGCPAYVMSVDVADALIKTERCRTITCVGAENLEKMADPRHLDYTLYGSAAGAATYQASNEPGIVCSFFKGFGELWNYLRLDKGIPLNGEPTGPYLVMEGHSLYKFVRRELPNVIRTLIDRFKGKMPDLNLAALRFLLHQMNGKLMENFLCDYHDIGVRAKDLRNGILPDVIRDFIDKHVPWSVSTYGNSSGATIPVTEDHARRGLILKRFSREPFGEVLAIGSGTPSLNASAGAGFIFGGFFEIL